MNLKKYILIISCYLLLISHCLNAINNEIREDIHRLVKSNPYQLSEAEYTMIAETLASKTPCHMLVFGVGRDSKLWKNLNHFGTTVFLEDNENWLREICAEVSEIKAYLVKYNTQRKDWLYGLIHNNQKELLLNLPAEILEMKWDIIFVDGPEGWSDEKPGRMKSIFTAAQLAHQSKDCYVFVHDCDRPVEAIYSRVFLCDENLIGIQERLRKYYIPLR